MMFMNTRLATTIASLLVVELKTDLTKAKRQTMTELFMELITTHGRNVLSMIVTALSTHTHGWMKMAQML
jgi:hypothetical protein